MFRVISRCIFERWRERGLLCPPVHPLCEDQLLASLLKLCTQHSQTREWYWLPHKSLKKKKNKPACFPDKLYNFNKSLQNISYSTIYSRSIQWGQFLLHSPKKLRGAQQIWWADSNGPVKSMHLLSELNECKPWTCGAFAKPAGKSTVRSSLAPFVPAGSWKLISPCPPFHQRVSLIPQSLCVPLAMSCLPQATAFPNASLKYGPPTFLQVSPGLLSWTDTCSRTKPDLIVSLIILLILKYTSLNYVNG